MWKGWKAPENIHETLKKHEASLPWMRAGGGVRQKSSTESVLSSTLLAFLYFELYLVLEMAKAKDKSTQILFSARNLLRLFLIPSQTHHVAPFSHKSDKQRNETKSNLRFVQLRSTSQRSSRIDNFVKIISRFLFLLLKLPFRERVVEGGARGGER